MWRLLARISATSSAMSGVLAVSSASRSMYSWRDCPLRAARAASSFRVSSGTLRMVMVVMP
ncbi:hypothetical protein AXK60_20925 [Tsukamurella pseudospumae]|uniref:Uncharacterized protein n=1 Tax=Tsukamurella pseudospumae TaxID=239498 RepID=A0A138AV04_9ACTN|nr:hypothetical protein AXK60_20925 [Tsukamurella pseudospumae]